MQQLDAKLEEGDSLSSGWGPRMLYPDDGFRLPSAIPYRRGCKVLVGESSTVCDV